MTWRGWWQTISGYWRNNMKIHTVLTGENLRDLLDQTKNARQMTADVFFVQFRFQVSRSRPNGYLVQLGTSSQWSLPSGRSRHFKNTGKSGADGIWAASYDEWGWFLARVFAADPSAIAGHWKSKEMFMEVTKGAFTLPTGTDQLLTYAYLASLAVMPDSDHDDVNMGDVHEKDGAYAFSPLGEHVGLHIHADTDRWYETEPEAPVHFVVSHAKIASVYPHGVVNLLRNGWRGENWAYDTSPEEVQWMNRLLAANPEITMSEVSEERMERERST
jgi:hypothetical protein